MNVLITGVNGFVGKHLAEYLLSKKFKVYGFDLQDNCLTEGVVYSKVDITHANEFENIFGQAKYDYVFHLAGFSSVAGSFDDKKRVFAINVEGTRNLLEAITTAEQHPVILIASTANVYGKAKQISIDENHPVNCLSPYAESKYGCERIALHFFEKHGLKCIITRNFNIIGPGQSDRFVCSSFAKQIVSIETGGAPELSVGNIEAKRDFTDIRDVVIAYLSLVENGKPGEIYNLGSGKSYPISAILNKLLEYSNIQIKIINDPDRMRSNGIPILQADISKLKNEIGWTPKIKIEQSLKDILDYWRNKVQK